MCHLHRNRPPLTPKPTPPPLSFPDNNNQNRTKYPYILDEYAKLEPQIFIYWDRHDNPIITGNIEQIKATIGDFDPLLFSGWIPPDQCKIVDLDINTLKIEGKPFQNVFQANTGKYIEINGKIIDNTATIRIKNIDVQQRRYSELNNEFENLKVEIVGLRAMLNTLSHPIWLREQNGRLSWVNEQYAYAVDTMHTNDVISKQIEFLDSNLQNEVLNAIQKGEVFQTRIPVVVSGQRRILDVIETPLASGSIGYATDISDLQSTRHELQTQMASHGLTLDQLPTAVAIFDEKQRLIFCNIAYRTLWQLDEKFTASNPTDSEVLDHLRNNRRLPEQSDYKGWKKSLHEAYHSLETQEAAWYLPGGRTLRVVINPNPQGGVTYLFEDVTAQFILQSNFNALSRVQSETLDSLKEGVAVFGTDGRLKLNNPAFATLWNISHNKLSEHPHIDEIINCMNHIYNNTQMWDDIKGIISGFNDSRKVYSFRMERNNGTVVDCNLAPLPDGATLVTFIDISASVNVERALKDKNDALEQAAQLRENFVHHVSYQLRSPLTNVIGFTELLASGAAGAVTKKQSEYIDHVYQSSHSLMAIVDDILDLASFDRGEIILERKYTIIKNVINSAIEGLKDRIEERKLVLNVEIPDSLDKFYLDERRLRQILFNLISNAIGFSSERQLITISARLQQDNLKISVKDNGRGIPDDVIKRVFDRFETYTIGSRHRGAGLGLSIVRSLVELHGGTVSIESQSGKGTVVNCVFPPENAKPISIDVV
jgi:signal transduction histidine kinase